MKGIFFLCAFALMASVGMCSEEKNWPCWMLTPEEEAFAEGMDLEEEIQGMSVLSGEAMNNLLSSGLYLGGIVYINEGNWSFWLNGQKISVASDLPEEFTLRLLSAHSVSLTWNRGGEMHLVTLKPHHTYDPIQRRIRLGNCLCKGTQERGEETVEGTLDNDREID